MSDVLQQQSLHERPIVPIVRKVMLGLAMAWLTVVATFGWWMSQRLIIPTARWCDSIGIELSRCRGIFCAV